MDHLCPVGGGVSSDDLSCGAVSAGEPGAPGHHQRGLCPAPPPRRARAGPRKRSPSKTRPPRPSTPFPPETGPHRPQPRQRIFHGPPCSPGCGPRGQGPPCFGPQSPTPDSAGRWRRPCRWRKGSMRATASPPPSSAACLRPRIYLPASLPAEDRHYVLLHERAHLHRGTTGPSLWPYLALCLHWFNPLLWLAYRLFCRDVEAACDRR